MLDLNTFIKSLPKDIRIVAASKYADLRDIVRVYKCGVCDFGENRVLDAEYKYQEFCNYINGINKNEMGLLSPCSNIRWHFIGSLQSNKIKKIVRFSNLIHSVDRLSILKSINSNAEKIDKIQDVLVQVNSSGEENKHGIKFGDLEAIFKEIYNSDGFRNIRILGLMTIGPNTNDRYFIRKCFRETKLSYLNLAKRYSGSKQIIFKYLSMGMTNDYEIALEEGSNMLRIGRLIFNGQ